MTESSSPSAYHLIIVVALAIAAGRIAVVTGKDGSTAFLSANDRSRWCTVAALVEDVTYAIDRQIEITDPIMRNRRPWQTIDKVRHFDIRTQRQLYYSSKPPLFPTLVAIVYAGVQAVMGMSLTEEPKYIARIVLALVNLPLLALFCYGSVLSMDRVIRSEWTRVVAALCCCFATMLLPFAISLNNHLPAAAATAAAMWMYLVAAERIETPNANSERGVSFGFWMVAGISAAFAAANELPALSMLVFWFLLFGWLSRASIPPFLLGVALVAIGFFGTNWIAHHSLRPPYAHRGNGTLIANLMTKTEAPNQELSDEVSEVLGASGLSAVPIMIVDSDEEDRWIATAGEQLFAIVKQGRNWHLHQWDDWYEYSDSYWKDGRRVGVDRGEPSRLVYCFHMTFGHHGLFSLTPIWLMVPVGLVAGLFYGTPAFRRLAFCAGVATVVCFLFYLSRPLIDRNYGGVSVCFRWMLWFAPLWLLVIAPPIESFSESRALRIFFGVLLAISVMSMSTSLASPWQSPWLYQFWQFLGWI